MPRHSQPRLRILRIVKAERVTDRFGDDSIRIWVQFGRYRLAVLIGARRFTEARLKQALARKLASEFGLERARSLVGKRYGIREILEAGSPTDDEEEAWFQ